MGAQANALGGRRQAGAVVVVGRGGGRAQLERVVLRRAAGHEQRDEEERQQPRERADDDERPQVAEVRWFDPSEGAWMVKGSELDILDAAWLRRHGIYVGSETLGASSRVKRAFPRFQM